MFLIGWSISKTGLASFGIVLGKFLIKQGTTDLTNPVRTINWSSNAAIL
jgi:hypothetical protein